MSDQTPDTPAPKKLTTNERLARVEKALTDGLRIDLDQYDEAAINAERARLADELGITDAENAKAADAEAAAANEQVASAVQGATDPAVVVDAVTATPNLRNEDALAHVNAALGRWPDDADLLAIKADLEAPQS